MLSIAVAPIKNSLLGGNLKATDRATKEVRDATILDVIPELLAIVFEREEFKYAPTMKDCAAAASVLRKVRASTAGELLLEADEFNYIAAILNKFGPAVYGIGASDIYDALTDNKPR